MELFLNFAWLLLFVPAWRLWRRNGRHLSSVRCFFALACALVILFPVISATDDLHSAPQAMEESSSTKRTLKHSNVTKSHNCIYSPPAQLALAVADLPSYEATANVHDIPIALIQTQARGILGERAPPRLALS